MPESSKRFPDAFESVWNFFYAGKLFMVFLLALSLLSIAVIIYKVLDLRRHLVLPEDAVRAIESIPASLGVREAGALAGELRSSRSVVGRLGLVALAGDHADKEDASRAVEARAREEVVELESGIALLEVVITIAPLLGLLGTVSGLVNVFSNLGDSADHSAIAIGIAEALNTTIAGLAIAVPTVVAHSFFMKKIERMGVRLEILLSQLLAAVFRKRVPDDGLQVDPLPVLAEDERPAFPAPAPTQPPVVYAPVPDHGASSSARSDQAPAVAERAPSSEVDPDPAVSQSAAPDGAAEFPRLLSGYRPEPAARARPDESAAAPGAEQPT